VINPGRSDRARKKGKETILCSAEIVPYLRGKIDLNLIVRWPVGKAIAPNSDSPDPVPLLFPILYISTFPSRKARKCRKPSVLMQIADWIVTDNSSRDLNALPIFLRNAQLSWNKFDPFPLFHTTQSRVRPVFLILISAVVNYRTGFRIFDRGFQCLQKSLDFPFSSGEYRCVRCCNVSMSASIY
jgi:hypothetical protein